MIVKKTRDSASTPIIVEQSGAIIQKRLIANALDRKFNKLLNY
tara:strand:- start:837 stop:965 length:129 start_codon:yes stop_codon:yes gene_type:complete